MARSLANQSISIYRHERDTSVIIVWSKPIRRIKNVKTDDGIIRTVYSSLQLCSFRLLRLLHLLCFLHLFCFVCGSLFWLKFALSRVFSFIAKLPFALIFLPTHFALICFDASPRCVLLFLFNFLPFLLQPCSVLGLKKQLLVACLLPLYRTLFFGNFFAIRVR